MASMITRDNQDNRSVLNQKGVIIIIVHGQKKRVGLILTRPGCMAEWPSLSVLRYPLEDTR